MKGAGKKIFKNKQINKNIQKKKKKKNTTRVQESWLNLKDTPRGIMEFNTASEEECKKKEMTSVILKFEG